MKIRTRLAIAFLTITVLPMSLIYLAIQTLYNYQGKTFREAYGIEEEEVNLAYGASIRVFSHLTEAAQMEVDRILNDNPDRIFETEFLDTLNQGLSETHSFVVLVCGDEVVYTGNPDVTSSMANEFAVYDELGRTASWGNYLDSDTEHLIKQRRFECSNGQEGAVLLITNAVEVIPEVKYMFTEMMVASGIILFITGALMITWIYHSIWSPLGKLQEATMQIRDGNLDFTLDVEDDDEFGQLCQDFEEMRIRLKETTEEKIQYDKESKELISNISHDLKTPITAIKGYVEGIMDGVASSPEKLDRYIRTIYNKANDMDRLIDELTFYSKIDTNKIPYAFSKINVSEYFGDCVDEVGLDLEARGVELGYFNYVDEDVLVIADAEQIKRVINNIIGNSLKYMDKKKGIINIRILDVGDFVQIEIEDNGKGIGQK